MKSKSKDRKTEEKRQLQSKIKHLTNELRLVKEESETTSEEYYELAESRNTVAPHWWNCLGLGVLSYL